MKLKEIDKKRHEVSLEAHNLFLGIFDAREAEKSMSTLADQYSELKEAAACATATRKKAEDDMWKLCRKKEQTADALGLLSEYGFELDQPVAFSEDVNLILRFSGGDKILFEVINGSGSDVGYLFEHACRTVTAISNKPDDWIKLTDIQDMNTDQVDFLADVILRRAPCQKMHDDIAHALKRM